MKVRRRLEAFVSQLELALHLMAGGLRVGLSMRQALASVVDELPDPASYEFRRVIGQTTIGVSMLDAMDDLARRMPNNETLMVARVFRVQSQTGGDLARILDQLAETIKGRRQVDRKIGTLTAEGKMSAWVLMAIPIGLGLFICTTQADDGARPALHAGSGTWCCSLLPAWRPAPISGLRASCGSKYDARTSRLCDPGALRRRRILLRAVAAAVEKRPHAAARGVTGSRFVPARPRGISARNQGSHARSAHARFGDCSPRPDGTRRRRRSSSCESSRVRASVRS